MSDDATFDDRNPDIVALTENDTEAQGLVATARTAVGKAEVARIARETVASAGLGAQGKRIVRGWLKDERTIADQGLAVDPPGRGAAC